MLSSEIKSQLKDAYDKGDSIRLVRTLLELDKFPIKGPYVTFLRKKDVFLTYNPNTVGRLAQTLFSMGFNELISGSEEPKEFNRQIGALFRNWLPKPGFPFVPEDEFDKYKGIAFLSGSNEGLDASLRIEMGNPN